MARIDNDLIPVTVLHNQAASEVKDGNGKVISTGSKMNRVRIDAFPQDENGHFDFAGFVETKATWWFQHLFEKLFYNHVYFQGVVEGEVVDVWLRAESVRKRLGIGNKEFSEEAKSMGVRKSEAMNLLFIPFLRAIRNAQQCGQSSQESLLPLLEPRQKFLQERVSNPQAERHRLSSTERESIQSYATTQWSQWKEQLAEKEKSRLPKEIDPQEQLNDNLQQQASLQRELRPIRQKKEPYIRDLNVLLKDRLEFFRPLPVGSTQQDMTERHELRMKSYQKEKEIRNTLDPLKRKEALLLKRLKLLQNAQYVFSEQCLDEVFTIEISKEESGLPHDLIVTSYPSQPGELPEMRLLVVLDIMCDIEVKELYPVIDFYHPEERLFMTHEGAGGVAAHERAMRRMIRRSPIVSQPIASFSGMRELFSVDQELERMEKEYPVITHPVQQEAGDLICHVEDLHFVGVHLGAFKPISYVEEMGEDGPISRGAILGLEYASTPLHRAADETRARLSWGNPLYYAPEVAREAQKRQSLGDSLSAASDMWVLGLRIMNLYQHSFFNPCATLRAHIKVALGREPENDYEVIEQISQLGEGWLDAPEDRGSMEYLAYLMLNPNPAKRITSREALRRYYGMVVQQTVEEVDQFFAEYRMVHPPEGGAGPEGISALLQRAMRNNLLGRDMRFDYLSSEAIIRLINQLRPLANRKNSSEKDFKKMSYCLRQLLSHPKENPGRA